MLYKKLPRVLSVCAVVSISLECVGCTSISSGVAADSASTYFALNSGVAHEANSLLPKEAIGASLASAVAKVAVLEVTKTYLPESCVPTARSLHAVGWGAAANNLAILASASGYIPIVAAVLVGAAAYETNAEAAQNYCSSPSSIII